MPTLTELVEMKLYASIIEADLLSFLQRIFFPIPSRRDLVENLSADRGRNLRFDRHTLPL